MDQRLTAQALSAKRLAETWKAGNPSAAAGSAGRRTGEGAGSRLDDLAQIINGFPDGVLLTDRQGVALFANRRLYDLLGLAGTELVGLSFPELVVALDWREGEDRRVALVDHPITHALEGDAVQDGRFAVPAGGYDRHLAVHAGPLEDPEGRVLGAVVVVRDVTDWVYAQERLESAVAVERRRASQLRLFNQLMLDLSGEEDEGRLLDEALHGAMRLTGAREGFAYLMENSHLRLEAFHSTARWSPRPPSARAKNLALRAVELDRAIRGSAPDGGALEHLAVPIRGPKGRVDGCLIVSGTPAGTGFSVDDEVFVSNLAAHLSVALENLHRVAHEREVAQYLQRSMLPRIVPVAGLEVDFKYRSASDVALVGGDFYDLVPLSDDRVAIVVGDVCGKGLSAATQTAKARYIVRAYADFGYDPGRWLAAVHQTLHSNLTTSEFVTSVLVILDPATGELEYSLAGHPPPLAVLDGRVRELGGRPGLPLGFAAEGEYTTCRGRLEPGETLLLFTDGLFEARRGARLFGIERLEEAAGRLLRGPLSAAGQSLIEEAREYAGGRLADDVVVGLVRRAPSQSR